jgi:hypothetical protein
MKHKQIFYLLLLLAAFLTGCSKCEKLHLTQSDKSWVDYFAPNQSFYYKNSAGRVDTLMVTDTANRYTLCNKFELSEYQYEIYRVDFKIISPNQYSEIEPSITVTTEVWQKHIPYIHFGNLGPHQNDLENKKPIAIDTILNGIKLESVYYYAKGLNTEQYGEKEYFKNFFWDKSSGLVAYTTMNDEIFLRVNQKVK